MICETLTNNNNQPPTKSQTTTTNQPNHDILPTLAGSNNCFIIQSPSLFPYFNHSLTAQGSDLDNVVSITHEQNIICSETRLDGTTHEQTIICGQLFAGRVVGPRKDQKKNASNDQKSYRTVTFPVDSIIRLFFAPLVAGFELFSLLHVPQYQL